ncbi:MAG: CGNR zinc finger domain-containing protein [Segniliparus sp.]|uniref:CGNR zinc finger domain-containing protein n=1 Tax=Segniliparus sp. TaxID=2804064 RepID=UPI003F32AB2C
MVTVVDAAAEETGFTFISGDVVLDFAGTLRYRRTRREELLRSPDDLARWLALAGVLDQEPAVAEAEFAAAVELREAVYEIAAARLERGALPGGALALVNGRARQSRVTLQLAESGVIRREGGASEALATIALHAVRLFGSDAPLRQCGADNCTRIFVDRSRRGDRRWCDMARCGNRDKARAHRARRAAQRL